jgi:hypothetical protein
MTKVRACVFSTCTRGCQMVCFQTKNINLGRFWRALDWKMLIYLPFLNIIRTFGIFMTIYVVHFVFNISGFGIMYQVKSGIPACTFIPRRLLRKQVMPKTYFRTCALNTAEHEVSWCWPGWPDWANFRLVGDGSSWAVFFWKLHILPEFSGYLFPRQMLHTH